MKLGMIGLGKMGANMVTRLLSGGCRVVAYDPRPEAVEKARKGGAEGAASLAELVDRLEAPRAVWLMVPAGEVVDSVLGDLERRLSADDVVVDGGNSYYKDTLARGERLRRHGLHLVDVGTSGGVWGLAEGYSMMVGGDAEVVERLHPALEVLAPGAERGWGRVGPPGAGHFVKMVHNGIEYGLMQAYAEGFALLEKKTEMELDLHQVAEIWRYGSVVRSWLLDLAARALADDPRLEEIAPWVADSGEGRWTVQEAVEMGSSAPVLAQALFERFRSRDETAFGDRLLAALRNQFGGHAVRKAEGED